MKKRFTFTFALAALLAAAQASPSKGALAQADGYFKQANQAYEHSDYAGASDLYRKALDEGVVNSRLYFNYANSLIRLNKLGPAILYYEKARKLAPDDEDIAYNLRFANARTIDKNPAPEANALTKALWFLHSAYTINQGMWICLALFSAIFLAALSAVFAGTALRGILYAIVGVSVVALLVITPSLAYKIHKQETVQYGIVLKSDLEMYSGPGENYQVLTKVHEGTKFEIVETRGDWVSVKLMDGKGGFVRYADLGKV